MAEVCSTCGLPKDLCVCEELEKEETRIVVRLEMRRFRKPTTMVEGLNPKRSDLEKIAHDLKIGHLEVCLLTRAPIHRTKRRTGLWDVNDHSDISVNWN